MAFKTIVSVAAAALALVAAAQGATAAPARAAASVDAVARQAVGGGSQVVVVPRNMVTSFGNKRGDDKKVNVEINVDIEKEEEENPEYGHKKGDDKEVNVKINVDVKKEKKEVNNGGVQLVSGLTQAGQPQLVPVTQQLPGLQ